MNMKKSLIFICFAACATLAYATDNIVKAYNKPEGGYVLIDSNGEVVGFSNEGKLAKDNAAEVQSLLGANGLILEIAGQEQPGYVPAADYVMSDSVGPLLGDIAFNQGYPYNMYTPVVENKNLVTGCVATAMAQIMAFWKYPSKCRGGRHEYTTSKLNKTLSLDFDTISFNWDKVIPNYGAVESDDDQKREISKIMYACGVSVNMNYTQTGSGTQSSYVPSALIKYFNYKSDIMLESQGSNFDNDDVKFLAALIDEIDAGHPMYCSATATDPNFASYDGGHAFVIDGYGWVSATGRQKWNSNPSETTQPFIHFNWGWGGTDQIGNPNLWYRITGDKARAPYSNIQIIRGIVPADYTADEQVEMTQDGNGAIYDILGRKVTATEPGQIYIRNGRKFIQK